MTARILPTLRPPRAPGTPSTHRPPGRGCGSRGGSAGPGQPARGWRGGAEPGSGGRRSGGGGGSSRRRRRRKKKGEKKRHEWGLAPPPGAHGIRRAAAGSRPEPRGGKRRGQRRRGAGGTGGQRGAEPYVGLQGSPAKWFWRKKGKRGSGKGLSAPAGPRWSRERSDGSALLLGARGWATCRCRKG